MTLGNGQEGAVPVGFNGEDQRFSGQDGQLSDQLPRMGDEQDGLFFAVNLLLINMEESRDNEADIDIL